MTAKMFEQDICGESAALTDQAQGDLVAGYREMGPLNLFLAEEAVYSDEEALEWILKQVNEGLP